VKFLAGVLLFAFAAASPEIRFFQYERPIRNPIQRPAQTCLVLDAGIFAHAALQLADLRLYRGRTETPYVIRFATPKQDAEQSIALLNLGVRGGQTVFDAAVPEGRYGDLQLAVAAQNFIATVTVSGSQAQTASISTQLGSYTIFDLTRQKLGRSTVLHLPESDFRYLHFRITGPLPPESVTSLSVERVPASKPKYQTVAQSSAVTQKGRSSVLEFTVPAPVPVDRIAFIPNEEPVNFSRDVIIAVAPVSEVPVTDAAEPPQPVISRGNLLRVHSMQNGHRIDEERLEVDTPGAGFATAAKWTITIENGDDAPLMLKSVALQMLERNLCFEAAGQANYALFYGDPALTGPRYDYARLFTLQADASEGIAGPERQNPEYQARPDERPFTEKHPALLWTALILVIVLLGAIALRSAKQATQTGHNGPLS
jgi:hypothetical protein